MSTLIYLLRRDLRLADNPVFHALEKGDVKYKHLLPIYIVPPHQIEVSGFTDKKSPYPEARSQVGKFWRCGPHRAKFIAESVWDLKASLKGLNSDVIVRVGPMHDVIKEVLESKEMKGNVGAVWMTRDWASEERREENAVRRVVEGKGVDWKVWDGEEMLIHDGDMPCKASSVSDIFTEYRKTVEPLRDNVRKALPAPKSLPSLPKEIPPQPEPFHVPDSLEEFTKTLLAPLLAKPDLKHAVDIPSKAVNAHPFKGGESTIQERLKHLVSSGVMTHYKDTRNGMIGQDFSTKLSAWLALGCITARQVHAALYEFEEGNGALGKDAPGYGKGENKGTTAVRFELLWRDYMRLCMRKYGDSLFAISGFHGKQKNIAHSGAGKPPQ